MKKLTTTKKLIIFLFGSCILLELFVGYVTIENLRLAEEYNIALDFSPLLSLIGAVVGEVVAYAVYCLKSLKENTVGGVIYESTMQKQKQEQESINLDNAKG